MLPYGITVGKLNYRTHGNWGKKISFAKIRYYLIFEPGTGTGTVPWETRYTSFNFDELLGRTMEEGSDAR